MTIYAELRQKRSEARKAKLDAAARAIAAWASTTGVEVRVFGSFARGRVDPNSDLDVLIVSGFSPENRYRIASLIEEVAEPFDVPVDVAFADMAPHLVKESVAC